jgi:hypothetical protein
MKKRFQVGQDSRKGGKKRSMKEKTRKSCFHTTLTIDSTRSQMPLAEHNSGKPYPFFPLIRIKDCKTAS